MRPLTDLGLYSITFTNDLDADLASLEAFRAFREDAAAHWFSYFLEVFNPNVDAGLEPESAADFVNDAIVRCLAGLTEVVVPAQRPTRADQYDTVVVPKHRGYGLGRAIKARMLFELRSAEPRVTEVQTWNAFENEPMLKVNSELGFQPDRQWSEYEADVADLARLLHVNGA